MHLSTIPPYQESLVQPEIQFDPLVINVTIPGEPISGSQLKFNRKTGFAYRPDKHKQRIFEIYEFTKRALENANVAMPAFGRGVNVVFKCTLVFSHNKGHFGTGKNANVLKPSAPTFCQGRSDIDNLLKPLKDGLKGLVYHDDRQIVRYEAIEKRYGLSPATHISVWEVN